MKKLIAIVLGGLVALAAIDSFNPKVERAGGFKQYQNFGHGADKV